MARRFVPVSIVVLSSLAPCALGASPGVRRELPLREYEVPSWQLLAAEAGLPPNFEPVISSVERFLDGNMSPSERESLERSCEASRSWTPSKPELLPCFALALDRRLEAKIRASRVRRVRPVAVRTSADWRPFSNMSLSEVMDSTRLATWSEVSTAARAFDEVAGDCSLRTAGASIIFRAESHLPQKEALELMDATYRKVSPCLDSRDEVFERAHLRMGLTFLARGQMPEATRALEEAQRAADPRELHRTLFWLGVLARSSDAKPPQDPWDVLVRRFPLEIHAVIASHFLRRDPMGVSETPMAITRRSAENSDETDAAGLIFELLLSRNNLRGAKRWAWLVQRGVETREPSRLLFLARCAQGAGAHLDSFALLTRYLRTFPEPEVSRELLAMLFPRPYLREILEAAGDIDPLLLLGLIRQESAFEPMAHSSANARGLMQLLPSTAKRWVKLPSSRSLFEPQLNLRAGARFLSALFERFEGQEELVLSAYNAGPTPIDRWRERFPEASRLLFSDLIPYRETRFYVSTIQRNAYWYGRLLGGEGDETRALLTRGRNAKWKSGLTHLLLGLTPGGSSADEPLSRLFALPQKAPEAVPELQADNADRAL